MPRLPLTVSAVCILAGVSATSVAHAAEPTSPVLRVSDGDLVWNDVATGSSSSKTLTVSNTGGGTLPVGTPAGEGGEAGDFSVSSTTCANARLAARQSCTVTVTFRPTAKGSRVSHLKLATGIEDCTSYATLVGSGGDTTSSSQPERHGGFSRTCDGSLVAAQTPTRATPPPSGGVFGTTQSGGKCQSKRRLRIHLKAPKGKRFTGTAPTVTTKGRTFQVKRINSGKRRGQYYSDLSFTGLAVGRYAVRIQATLNSGTYSRTRYFVTCVAGNKTP